MGETKEHILDWIRKEVFEIYNTYEGENMSDNEMLQLLEHAYKLQRYIEKLLGGEYND